MIEWVCDVVLIGLGIAFALAAYRIVLGPTISDRIVALDGISSIAIAAVATYSVKMGSLDYLDVIWVIAVLSFITTVTVAKFLVKGVIVDRGS